MGCLIFLIVLAVALFVDWSLAQLAVFAAAKVFGFETNIWQVILVFVAMTILELVFKSGAGTKGD